MKLYLFVFWHCRDTSLFQKPFARSNVHAHYEIGYITYILYCTSPYFAFALPLPTLYLCFTINIEINHGSAWLKLKRTVI